MKLTPHPVHVTVMSSNISGWIPFFIGVQDVIIPGKAVFAMILTKIMCIYQIILSRIRHTDYKDFAISVQETANYLLDVYHYFVHFS